LFSSQRLKALAFSSFKPPCTCLFRRPSRGYLLSLLFKWVLLFLHAQPVYRLIPLFLLCFVLLDCLFIHSHCTHIVSLTPEVPVPIFVLQVRMPLKDLQRTLPLQLSHHTRYTVLRWNTQQHVDVIRHHVPFDYLHPLLLAQFHQNLFFVFPYLIVDYFSPILWREYDVIFAHPFRVCQTVCFIGHTKHLSSLVCGLNIHILSERCFGLGVTLYLHPHSGWFSVSLVSRVRLP
jgi:hypothetical protein